MPTIKLEDDDGNVVSTRKLTRNGANVMATGLTSAYSELEAEHDKKAVDEAIALLEQAGYPRFDEEDS